MGHSIEITKADNGYICEWYEDGIRKYYCAEDNEENEYGDIEAMKNILRFISDHFGVISSEHSKKNLLIKVVNTDEDSD